MNKRTLQQFLEQTKPQDARLEIVHCPSGDLRLTLYFDDATLDFEVSGDECDKVQFMEF